MSDIRKYINLIESAAKLEEGPSGYSVQVASLDGVYKRFKSLDDPAAQEWKQTVANKPKEPKVPKAPVKKLTLRDVYDRVETAIGNSFPDGDPIDHFGPWLEKNKLTMDHVDRAFRKFAKTSYNQYLVDMWDSTAGDAIHDAKNGHVDHYSPYYDVAADGVITPKANPWK